MASIKLDTTPVTGKCNDFELAATHLLPYDPVAKKRTGNHKRGAGNISDTTGADISSFGAKEGIGKTGVHLRYHKDDEYATLTRDQADELREWRLTPEGKKQTKRNKGSKGSKGGTKKGGGDFIKRQKRDQVMAASVNKQVEKRLAELQKKASSFSFEEPSNDEARAYIMALLEEKKPTTVSAATVRNVTNYLAKVTLKSIMAKSKNHN
jgi:hypothetical protein